VNPILKKETTMSMKLTNFTKVLFVNFHCNKYATNVLSLPDPMKWIRSHLPVHPRTALPSHVVIFDVLAPRITDFLSIYQPIDTFFHADYNSERVGKNVLLYERINPTRFTKSPPEAVTNPPSNIDDNDIK
jgi:hypothetical protein